MPSLRPIACLALVSLIAACANPGPGEAPDGIFDPQEGPNRRVHAFNKRLDTALSGAGSAGSSVPLPVRAGIENMADTVSLPQTVVNQLLQLRLGRATRNTARFSINATVGLLGLLDPAEAMGLPEDESDFGETLHVWGLPEGSYIELPVLGPSTERDAVGMFVDIFTNPLSYVLPPNARYTATGVRLAERVLDRSEYADQIDEMLYGSADSYAQSRTIYLQNRRYELGDESAGGAGYIDPEAIDTEGF
ncbi:VacJ family lipoprotein [Salipiger sp. 1_MG-2023]|uniref:MlaA family lipoprotein n=1 Tax=Salipiger sp. 1_MG-2023 TaxID=3062665 RepID=UPI0026E27A31|nr:VacJ family lipoprotein [Salipiger sp. 1_MG-2023]MDO6586349.1 VacJ family lipoprotein [Salipiger sp. 1_MG-2023]